MALRAIETMAPRPTRRSYSRSVYDALQALNGPATASQVAELIPTTDDADKWNSATQKRVSEVLHSACAHGYVMYNEATAKWSIATKRFYEVAQERVKASQAASAAGVKGYRSARPMQDDIYEPGGFPLGMAAHHIYLAGVLSGLVFMLAGFGAYALFFLS